jgi:hypothetical protein
MEPMQVPSLRAAFASPHAEVRDWREMAYGGDSDTQQG